MGMALISAAQTAEVKDSPVGVWSAGIKGGMTYPLSGSSFPGSVRGTVGFDIRRALTPIVGIGLEGDFSFNTSSLYSAVKSPTAADRSYLGLYGTASLLNLFGSPRMRTFDIEFAAGAGWIHDFAHCPVADRDSWGGRVGLNFNFTPRSLNTLTFSVQPSLFRDFGSSGGSGTPSYHAAGKTSLQLLGSVRYNFNNSGVSEAREPESCPDPKEVNDLNLEINTLRNDLENMQANNAALVNRLNSLKADNDALRLRPKAVAEVVSNLENVRYIFFSGGSAYIQDNQRPNLELVARAMESDPDCRLEITGFASPEGSAKANGKISHQRAGIVKDFLVKEYGIKSSRIEVHGMGVGDVFNVPSWNRVAVCTIVQGDKK